MRYDAFISYRHSPLDMSIAKKLHNGLETFKVPKSVQKSSGKKNIKRVFRDQEELPIGSDLDDNISAALADSEYLIVICSPRTPESEWVCKEIDTFIEMHDRSHVLAVLVEGEPWESFPSSLLTDENGEPVEPLAADVRGETEAERKKKLQTELIRLAAPLLNCTYDDLKQRHRERKIKRMTTIACSLTGVVAALGIAFAIYNANMAKQIEENYNAAVDNYNLAISNYDAAVSNYEQALANQSKYLADTALDLLEQGDREDAVVVALEALEGNQTGLLNEYPYVQQAEYALSEVLYTYDYGATFEPDRLLKHQLPVNDMVFSTDGEYILTIDNGHRYYLWNAESGNLVTQIDGRYAEDGNLNSPCCMACDGNQIVICNNNGFKGYDLSGNEIWSWDVGYVTFADIKLDKDIAYCVNPNAFYAYRISTNEVIQKFDTIDDFSFGAEMAYDEETERIIVSCSNDLIGEGFIALCDLKTGEIKQLNIRDDYVAELAFSSNGNVIAVTMASDSLTNIEDETYDVTVQFINIEANHSEWEFPFYNYSFEMNSSSVILKCREYTDELGVEHSEVVVSSNGVIYTLDQNTGIEISKLVESSAVYSVLLYGSSGYAYIGEKSGDIVFANLTEGRIYADYNIETGFALRDVATKNGVIAVRSIYNADVLLLKLHEGSNMITQDLEVGNFYDVYFSNDGQYLATRSSELTEGDKLIFYDSYGNRIGDTKEDVLVDGTALSYDFIADGEFAVVYRSGELALIHLETMNTRVIAPNRELKGNVTYSYMSRNGKYALLGGDYFLHVIDVDTEEHLVNWEDKENKRFGYSVIDEAGQKIYIMTVEDGLWSLDTTTGDYKKVNNDELRISLDMTSKEIIAISHDGKYLAVCCMDQNVRIVNTETMEVETVLPVAGRSQIFMYFTDNDDELILQGDNYYIEVFGMKDRTMLYTAQTQFNTVETCYENKEEQILAVVTSSGTLMLRKTDTYIPVAFVNKGCGYIATTNEVLSKQGKTLYRFPFQSRESLIEEAKKQFPNATLTDEMRLKYHINTVDGGLDNEED